LYTQTSRWNIAYLWPAGAEGGSLEVHHSLSLVGAIFIDLVDVNLVVPWCDGEMARDGREAQVLDAVGVCSIESDVVGNAALGGSGWRGSSRGSATEDTGHCVVWVEEVVWAVKREIWDVEVVEIPERYRIRGDLFVLESFEIGDASLALEVVDVWLRVVGSKSSDAWVDDARARRVYGLID
jgi:hypothetical protein